MVRFIAVLILGALASTADASNIVIAPQVVVGFDGVPRVVQPVVVVKTRNARRVVIKRRGKIVLK